MVNSPDEGAAAPVDALHLNGGSRACLSLFLKTWRQEKKLPLKVLAQELGVSIETVSAWEHGTRFPGAENLDNLSVYTGRPVCYFFGCRNHHESGPPGADVCMPPA